MYLQYAFVPSGSVTSLGTKPRFSANAGYATSISTPMCLFQSLEPTASLGCIEQYEQGLTVDAEPSYFSRTSSSWQS